MRAEFRSEGRKVDAFDKNLGSTQRQFEELTVQITNDEEENKKNRPESREATAQTNEAIEAIKVTQAKIEPRQAQALQQLQKQVLQELDERGRQETNGERQPQWRGDNTGARSEWVTRARAQPQKTIENNNNVPPPSRYTDIARKEERIRPQTTNTNGVLALGYVRYWKDQSIDEIRKALRAEIGLQTSAPANHSGRAKRNEHWSDVDAVRHINIFGTLAAPLLEVACTLDKVETLRTFFENQGLQVYDIHMSPWIDPTVAEVNETDNRKIAIRLRIHFARVLLAWWKAAHYIFSPETRLFYRRAFLQLIAEDGKIYDWPVFIKAIHIDDNNVNNKKDNPRAWFEYKQGFEFLDETETGKKAAVTVQSFSSNTAKAKTATPKRRRQDNQTINDNDTDTQKIPSQNRPPRNAQDQHQQTRQVDNDELSRTLYTTPTATRRNNDERLIDDFINMKESMVEGRTERKMLTQITNSAKRLALPYPRASIGKIRVQVQ